MDRRDFLRTALSLAAGNFFSGTSFATGNATVARTIASIVAREDSTTLDFCVHLSGPAWVRIRAWSPLHPSRNSSASAFVSSWTRSRRPHRFLPQPKGQPFDYSVAQVPYESCTARIGIDRFAEAEQSGIGTPGLPWQYGTEVHDRIPDGEGLDPAPDDAESGELDLVTREVPALRTGSRLRFAFGSCQDAGIEGSFAVGLEHEPAFFVQIGDLAYQDSFKKPADQAMEKYLAAYRDAFAVASFARLCDRVPLVAMPDDHDYGTLAGKSASLTFQLPRYPRTEIYLSTLQAFSDALPGVAYEQTPSEVATDPSTYRPCYRKWSVGDVEFFLLDSRRENLGPNSPQTPWLYGGLASSPARVKVVFCPQAYPRNTSAIGSMEKLLLHIDAYNRNRANRDFVLILSGDTHAAAFCTPLIRDGRGVDPASIQDSDVWFMLAGSLAKRDGRHGIPAATAVDPKNGFRFGFQWANAPLGTGAIADSDAVGIVEIETSGAQPYVNLRWRNPIDSALSVPAHNIDAAGRFDLTS